mmetsp:Transcript_4647/g.6123  ORF Transcript_4647/g.6123 Transcript_4647/m.6123 type:complete len:95 (-) Transcript_4647:642-926(-)
MQSRQLNKETWIIQSLGLVLGLVGGLSGIIWGVLAFFLNNYESFKFDNALIASVYKTAPLGDQDSVDRGDTSDEDHPQKPSEEQTTKVQGKMVQ